ncbi:hypothetical protein PR003_g26576 [Phytophthora rubi]|uniref:Uncharacterized protein n=1 Tax=Phytophthora rubi TaxID=129364 RepID=A0A6A4C9D5_9STRA|nr:hypothetical protein PR002_g25672 [Phytophthora rubi]KAE8976072.1 hypothetical protein PR001_g25521 [Phytophthora rubi]KAE9285458.1 hypothetical protein PR003_g26576 [Phytophthora rubi]
MSCKVVVIDSGEDKRKGYGVKHFIDFKGDVVAQYIRPHGTVMVVTYIGTNVDNRQDSNETMNNAADGVVETLYNVEPLTNPPDPDE